MNRKHNGLNLAAGGTKCYMQVLFMEKWCELNGILDTDIYKYFGTISMVSGGAILGFAIALGIPLSTVKDFFIQESPWIFTIRKFPDDAGSINASVPSNRPNFLQKSFDIVSNTPFYQSVDPVNSNYGSARIKKTLDTFFGNLTMQNLKTDVITVALDEINRKPVFYSNLDRPYYVGKNDKISDVLLRTASVPIMLPNYENKSDGGLVSSSLSTKLKTHLMIENLTVNRFNILSISTGIGEWGIEGIPTNDVENAIKIATGLFERCYSLSQEYNDYTLELEKQYTINQLNFYNFQPQLTGEAFANDGDATTLDYYNDNLVTLFNSKWQVELNEIINISQKILA